MPPSADQPALVFETHRNNFLFSDYYLDRRVAERREWQAADVGPALATIAALWRNFTPQSDNEAQTEYAWIRPVLEALGHRFNVQVSVRTPLGVRTPDYVFCPDAATCQRMVGRVLEERDLRGALAVGDAKAWDRPLDQALRVARDRTQPRTSENPSFQIDFYIRHTGLPWGILTNGQHWRLYHTDTSKRLDTYYEVDLPALIEQATAPGAPPEAVDAFKYFWLFFRQDAFTGEPSWLQSVLEESRAYEQGVSDNLKEQVYQALRVLAQGFLDFPENHPSTELRAGLEPTPDTLRTIYDNSLIVLYRLLFILYAEDRGLLPVNENAAYTERYSLHALKQRVARDLRRGLPAVASMADDWYAVQQLWRVLNTGNAELGVAAYNGGLFDPYKHPFLEQYRVGDSHLRHAIDLLARAEDPATGQREFVDYRDLDIRHLGSIYEGLLEYQLRCAEQPLAVRRERGREVYVALDAVPLDDGPTRPSDGEPTVTAGEAYLITDKGERKATGSYYTPDYIVQYIVEHTVGPVLEEVRERYADADGAIADETALVSDILALNILDPAMGSGHFLVAATDYIARYLVGLGLELAVPVSAMEGGELDYWRRRVVQACIYGVDVNPLAVELAKLSLWLNTVARDKPLSFLDHHLRPGNSLIGARVADLMLDGGTDERTSYQKRKERAQREAGQLSMLDDSAFVSSMRTASGFMDQIEALASETVADVREQERIYQETVRDVTRKFRVLADVWTARHFGLELDDQTWAGLARHVLREGFEVPQYDQIVAQAREIAAERRFFHWELEFPEVFFDEHGRLLEDEAGFDAVVGNPPWGASLGRFEHQYLRQSYRSSDATLDSFALFIEQGLETMNHHGHLGFIVPSGWQTGKSYVPFRKYVLQASIIRRLLNLPYDVFPDAYVDSTIIILKEQAGDGKKLQTGSVKVLTFDRKERLARIDDDDPRCDTVDYGKWFSETLDPSDEYAFLSYLRQEDIDISRKVAQRSIPIGQVADIQRGITPFHLQKDKPDNTYRVALDGELRRYYYEFTGTKLAKYDASIAEYKPPRYFRGPRLILRELISRQFRLQAVLVTEDFITNKSHQSILSDDSRYRLGYLLAVLNSRVLSHYHIRSSAIALRDDFPKIVLDETRNLPIREIDFTTQPDTRKELVRAGRDRYQDYVDGAPAKTVTDLVAEQLAHEPERADVVHDLLAFLAQQMIDLHQHRQRVERALDPFKFLDRGAEFVKLPQAFADEIKYGQLLRQPVDLGAVHHDIDGLRLVPAADAWELQAQLKLRDPEQDWQAWQYESDGNQIAREWTPVYRLPLDDAKARYYQHAFQVLGDFANAGSFPGGYTRSTMRKLQATKVPTYDPAADLTPLVELSAELAALRRRIERTDTLIDQIVYQLYGLTEEEIAVVEGRGAA